MILISKVIKISIILLTLVVVSCSSDTKPETEKAKQRHNILIFIAEDLSPDLGFNGNHLIQTPNIDGLAAQGMRFENAFSVSSVCSPSRTALITGMYPQTLGAIHLRYPENLRPDLPDSIQTIDQIFQANGYVTANINDGMAHGKKDWLFSYNEKEHFDLTTWKGISEQDAPFFAMFSTPYTHRPFEKSTQNRIPLDSISIPPYYPQHEVTQEDFANYYTSIETLDTQFGQVMDSLKYYDLDENTIVIFWADHGRSMVREKYHNYLASLHIPQIIYIPEGLNAPDGYQANTSFEAVTSSLDLSATMLDLAGISVPDYFHGEVFWNRDKEKKQKLAFSGSDRINETYFKTRSIFDGRFHYIRNYHHDFSINSTSTAYRKAHNPVYHLVEILGEKGQLTQTQQQLLEPLAYEELYDVEADPHEINNLASDQQFIAVLKQKRKELDSMLVEIDDRGMLEDSPEIKQESGKYEEKNAKRFGEKIDQLRKEVMLKVEKSQ